MPCFKQPGNLVPDSSVPKLQTEESWNAVYGRLRVEAVK